MRLIKVMSNFAPENPFEAINNQLQIKKSIKY